MKKRCLISDMCSTTRGGGHKKKEGRNFFMRNKKEEGYLTKGGGGDFQKFWREGAPCLPLVGNPGYFPFFKNITSVYAHVHHFQEKSDFRDQ